MTPTASILLGCAFGVANAVAFVVSYQVALERPPHLMLPIVFGSMLLRMMALLSALALVLAFVPVATGAFVAAFGVTFVLGLVGEVAFVMARPAPSARPGATPSL